MSNKRPAESNTDETPCKRTRTEEVVVCAICKDPDSPEPFTFLLCAHSFHTVCITPWLERSRRCPICRTVVRDSTAHSHDSDSYETDSEPDAIELYLSDSSTTISTSSSSSFLSTSSTTTMTSESDSDETLSHGDFDETLSQGDFDEIALWSSSDLYETDWSENNEFLIHCNEVNFNASNYTDTDSNEEE